MSNLPWFIRLLPIQLVWREIVLEIEIIRKLFLPIQNVLWWDNLINQIGLLTSRSNKKNKRISLLANAGHADRQC